MFIGSESLTDEEFATVTLSVQEYSQDCFNQLKSILEARESVSTQLSRLTYFFLAKGVQVTDTEPTPKSNIFLGSSL